MRFVSIIIALVLALGAGYAAMTVLKGDEPQVQTGQLVQATQPDVETVFVIVANRPIAVGEVITDQMLDSQPWPKNLVLSTFITGSEGAQQAVKMVARGQFQRGEPIVMNRLANPSDPNFLAAVLGKGMRMVTISTDNIGGLAGAVYPGDRVDVVLSHTLDLGEDDKRVRALLMSDPESRRLFWPDPDSMKITESVLTNVKVVAVNGMATMPLGEQAKQPPSSVSFEVTPKQALQLRSAQQVGYVSMVLRSLADRDDQDPTEVSFLSDYSGTDEAFSEVKIDAPAERESISVVRGVQSSVSESETQEKQPNAAVQ